MTPRRDGIRIRELRAGEYDVLDAVFDGLSPSSRYRRYHGGMPQLSAATRDALVAVDGRRHLAVGAFDAGRPIGIARLVQVDDHRAELAVEVVDEWQRRGIGALLVRTVAACGLARGIVGIDADVQADNVVAQGLFATLFPSPTVVDSPEIRLSADLAADHQTGGAATPHAA